MLLKEHIEKYKAFIQSDDYEEQYKWKFFNHFSKTWKDDLNDETIVWNLKNAFHRDGANLYSGRHFLPLRMLENCCEVDASRVANMFNVLFDEKSNIEERLKFFETEAESLVKLYSPDKELATYNGKRAMVLYLSLKFPNKYFLYKSSMYKKFCKITQFRPNPGNHAKYNYTKLLDYFQMCEEVRSLLTQDEALLELHKQVIPAEHHIDDDYHLLTQDFIYSVANLIDQPENEVKEELGSYNTSKKYWIYAPGDKASKWDEFYEEGIMGLGWDEIGDLNLLGDKDDIVSEIQIKYKTSSKSYNSALANLDFRDTISIGDVIIPKKGRNYFLGYGIVTSDYYYDELKSEYKKCRKVKWKKKGEWNESEADIVLKTLTDITKYSDYVKRLINLIGIEQEANEEKMNFPLNTILYGPPGTGKTYNTILRAANIVSDDEVESYDEALTIFKANLHDRIEFITFHQNYSYEDFIQGLRPDIENDNQLTFERKDGVFKEIADRALENILFSEKDDVELSNDLLFNIALEKYQDFILENENNHAINETAYILNVEEDAFRYTGDKWTNQSNGIRMKFSDLREFHRKGVRSRKDIKKLDSISGSAKQDATYYFLVFEQINKFLPNKVTNPQKVQKLNYVIIIDEINRANISRVFGELITLIEPDKRSHGAVPLEARLPSGDPFIVPSNLYIIGTMNTADKSIALLDIALRRRFEFESMYPEYEIKGQQIYDVDILKKINEKIINSKGHDFQIGHAYFMGENVDLIERMNKKVIPLLLEYYMNDEKEVKEILNTAGLKIVEKSWPLKISGRND